MITERMTVPIPAGFYEAEWVSVAALHAAPSFTTPQLVEVTPSAVRYSGLEVQEPTRRVVVDKPSTRPVQPGEFEELVNALVDRRKDLEAAYAERPEGGVAWAIVVRWRSLASLEETTFWTDGGEEAAGVLELVDLVGKVAGVGLELFVDQGG